MKTESQLLTEQLKTKGELFDPREENVVRMIQFYLTDPEIAINRSLENLAATYNLETLKSVLKDFLEAL